MPDPTPRTYTNPVIPGDWSDPGVLRVGEEYYSLRSTFGWQPGLHIAHSRDLVHWQLLGSADTDNAFGLAHGITDAGIWGSDIGYNPNTHTFLVYAPVRGVIRVFHATDPAGPYTDGGVVVQGYDPGFFADADGALYLTRAGGEIYRLRADGLRVEGDVYAHVAGGEGPEIFRRGEYYYYVISPGGTRPYQDHRIMSYRATDLRGPWEEDPGNPVMHAPHTSGARLQGPGHGEVFQTQHGEWFLTYHAYELSHYSLGRQMCLEPVRWNEDGWWRPAGGRIPSEKNPAPALAAVPCAMRESDTFDFSTLGPQWFFHTPPDSSGRSWSLSEAPGCLRIRTCPGDIASSDVAQRLFLQRVTRKAFEVTTAVTFDARHGGESAGLHLYHDPARSIWLTTTEVEGQKVIEVGCYDKPFPDERDPATLEAPEIAAILAGAASVKSVCARVDNPLGATVHLRMRVDGNERVRFAFGPDGEDWTDMGVELYFGDSWHHTRLGQRAGAPDLGWVGCGRANVWTGTTMGVFACGNEAPGSAHADFHFFRVV